VILPGMDRAQNKLKESLQYDFLKLQLKGLASALCVPIPSFNKGDLATYLSEIILRSPDMMRRYLTWNPKYTETQVTARYILDIIYTNRGE